MKSSAKRNALPDEQDGELQALGREFPFSDADFQALAKVAHEVAGIALSDSKRNLVYGRLSRRLRALGLEGFKSYRDYLASNPSEVQSFINAISTNLTKFFRESHHFKHLEKAVVEPFERSISMNKAGRLRIWSAGCSTGEEPYTIAAVIAREIPAAKRRDIRILATDIDTEVVSTASIGEYAPDSIADLPHQFRSMFRSVVASDGSEKIKVSDEVRQLITFNRLNLIESWPFKGKFDAIFCRNVMIYFDTPTKTALLDRFAEQIRPGGWLYIGHSESLTRAHPLLELEGKTIYRRRA